VRPRSSGLHHGWRALGHWLDLGSSGGVFHILGHHIMAKNIWADAGQWRHPIALQPAHPRWSGPRGGLRPAREGTARLQACGDRGAGAGTGTRRLQPGSAHAWGGGPHPVPGSDRCHRRIRDRALRVLALGAELPSALPGPMLITRLGRAQHPLVTPARFTTTHDPGEVTAAGWWQTRSLQLQDPWSNSDATASSRSKDENRECGRGIDPAPRMLEKKSPS